MPNLNKVMLMGNLTRDPELRHTPKGTAVLDVGMAINRYFSGDDGQRREETTFVDVTLWGRQAEIVNEYCSKGRPIYIEGRLNLDSWEDRTTGQQRTKLKVIGENIQLLGSRDGNTGGGGGGGGGNGGYQQNNGGYQPQPQQQPAYQAPPQQAQPQVAAAPMQAQPQQHQPAAVPAQTPAVAPVQEDDDDIPF